MRAGVWKISTFTALGLAGFLALHPLHSRDEKAGPNAVTKTASTAKTITFTGRMPLTVGLLTGRPAGRADDLVVAGVCDPDHFVAGVCDPGPATGLTEAGYRRSGLAAAGYGAGSLA